MPKYKVKEKFTVTRWSTVVASNQSEAIGMIESGDVEAGAELDEVYEETIWGTLEEV